MPRTLSTKGRDWPYFTDYELRSKDVGYSMMSQAFMEHLIRFREAWGAPLVINSAYRTEKYNSEVGGAPNSQHRLGRAVDISMAGHDIHAFLTLAFEFKFRGIGMYLYRLPEHQFIHLDMRVGKPVVWQR